MTQITSSTLTLALTCALIAAGCGDEEKTYAPQERCAGEGLALVGEGALERADGAVGELTLEAGGADGEVASQQMYLRLSGYDGGDGAHKLIVRLYGGGSGDLIGRIERAGAPLELDAIDITAIPAGNVSATALDRYPCTLEQGTICVQVGEDKNDNGILDDQDARVFNAEGGQVVIEALDTSKKRLRLRYDVTLGRNVFDLRSMSENKLAGCLDAGFTPSGESGWLLK